jgi:hypothetical protein
VLAQTQFKTGTSARFPCGQPGELEQIVGDS